MNVIFIIIIVAILFAQVITLLLSLTKMPIVKAGDVTEKCRKYTYMSKHKIKNLIVNGQSISTEGLQSYVVAGDSMSPYGIKNGNVVYVDSLNYTALNNEKQYPIVLFKFSTDNDTECDIKLRKFLSFIDIDNIDIQVLHSQYGKYVSIEQFTNDIQERISTIKKQENPIGNKYVLSITYLNKVSPTRFHYSIHNADKICGVVKYIA